MRVLCILDIHASLQCCRAIQLCRTLDSTQSASEREATSLKLPVGLSGVMLSQSHAYSLYMHLFQLVRDSYPGFHSAVPVRFFKKPIIGYTFLFNLSVFN